MKITGTIVLCVLTLFSFAQIQNMPLHEVFTSSTCMPCVSGNQNLTAIFNANPERQTVVKYQMNWPISGDPYYTNEGGTRRNYYNVNSVPRLFVDGNEFQDFSTGYFNPLYYTSSARDQYYFTDTYVNIEATHSIDLTNNKISVDLSVTPFADYNSNNKAFIAIIENITTGNVATNGETEFYSVMMKMLPDASGVNLGTLQDGNIEIVHQEYYLQSEDFIEEISDISVVVWVQDYIVKNIYQSDYSKLQSVYINEAAVDRLVEIYPNPAKKHLNLLINTDSQVFFRIRNMIGKSEVKRGKVCSSSIDVSLLKRGCYFIEFESGNNIWFSKFFKI